MLPIRRAALAACALALALPGGAAEARSWAPAVSVVRTDEQMFWREAAMTSAGAFLVVWTQCCDAGESRVWMSATPYGGTPGPAVDLGQGWNPDVAAGGDGEALIAWSTEQGLMLAVARAADGTLSPPAVLPRTHSPRMPKLAMNRRGDAAISFDGAWGGLWAAVRPAGGDWTVPAKLQDLPAQPGHDRATALTEDGRVLVAWADESTDTHSVSAAVGSMDGAFGQPQRLSTQGREARDVSASAAGTHAAVAWGETAPRTPSPDNPGWFRLANNGAVRTARLDGSGLTPPADVPGGEALSDEPQAGMAPDGTLTVGFTRAHDPDFLGGMRAATGGPDGLAPAVLVGDGVMADMPRITVSAEGEAVLAWRRFGYTEMDRPEAARLTAGAWAPAQDLRVPCPGMDHSWAERLATDAQGRVGAMLLHWPNPSDAWTELEAAFDSAGGEGTRSCLGAPAPPPAADAPQADAPAPPPPAPTPLVGGAPPGPAPMPGASGPPLSVTLPDLRRAQRTGRLRVGVRCASRCRVSGRLARGERRISTGRARGTAGRAAHLVLKIPRAKRGRRAEALLAITAADRRGTRAASFALRLRGLERYR